MRSEKPNRNGLPDDRSGAISLHYLDTGMIATRDNLVRSEVWCVIPRFHTLLLSQYRQSELYQLVLWVVQLVVVLSAVPFCAEWCSCCCGNRTSHNRCVLTPYRDSFHSSTMIASLKYTMPVEFCESGLTAYCASRR